VIDNPTIGIRYGATVSAPVFRQVAQQVLEYLGVPHDQPLKTTKEMQAAAATPDVPDSTAEESGADLTAMFDQINSLPADDPLRGGDAAPGAAAGPTAPPAVPHVGEAAKPGILPAKLLALFRAHGGDSAMPTETEAAGPLVAAKVEPEVKAEAPNQVVVDSGQKVAVPSFGGADLRSVVEHADAAGLRVQPVGSGVAREQVPAAGTMVPAGTEVVVRFTR